MKIYTVWGSEDQGFRFPATDVCYPTLTTAMLAATKAGGQHAIPFTPADLDDLSIPTAHGEVIVLLSYDKDIESIDDALGYVRNGRRDCLYAVDWIFIMEVEVDA